MRNLFFFSDFFFSIASIDLSALSDVSILSGRSLSCLFMNMNIVIEYWILLFYPDKLCSQVVVRGNVSGHRWSTYLLKQSMIESGYIIDGASFVLFNSFEADWLQFGWSWAVWSSLWAQLRGGLCRHSVHSWLTLVRVKPLLRSAWRTSASVANTTFSLSTSSWAGPGMLPQGGEARDGVGCFWLVAAAVPHLGCDGIAEVMEFRPELQNDNQST